MSKVAQGKYKHIDIIGSVYLDLISSLPSEYRYSKEDCLYLGNSEMALGGVGYNCCRIVRELLPDIHIIFLSVLGNDPASHVIINALESDNSIQSRIEVADGSTSLPISNIIFSEDEYGNRNRLIIGPRVQPIGRIWDVFRGNFRGESINKELLVFEGYPFLNFEAGDLGTLQKFVEDYSKTLLNIVPHTLFRNVKFELFREICSCFHAFDSSFSTFAGYLDLKIRDVPSQREKKIVVDYLQSNFPTKVFCLRFGYKDAEYSIRKGDDNSVQEYRHNIEKLGPVGMGDQLMMRSVLLGDYGERLML